MNENFIPSTPTEVMLVNEIRKLKIQLYETGKIHSSDINSLYSPEPMIAKDFVERIELHRTVRLLVSNAEPFGGIRVRMDVYCEDGKSFGSQYMHSEPKKLNRFHAADLAMQLHKTQLHNIANFLMDNDLDK